MVAGAIAGAAVAIIAAAFDLAASSILLAALPHQATFAAAEQSGGIAEVFTLPFILIVPATVLGLLGGLPAAISQGFSPITQISQIASVREAGHECRPAQTEEGVLTK